MLLNSCYGILVGINLLIGHALSNDTGKNVRRRNLIDTSVSTTVQYSSQSDVDFGVTRHEILDEDAMEQLGAFFHAGVFVNEQSAASATPMQYMMSASTKETGNYKVPLVFEYDCDTTDPPPTTSQNFEPSLIRYHEYVNEESNQGFTAIAITVTNQETSGCTPRTDGNGRRLLRGFRRTYVVYNLFAFCFGFCPVQALPEIPTVNRRRFLQSDGNIDLLSDGVPYLDQFKLIFRQQLDLTVTQSTTNLEETRRIDCSQPENCFSGSSCCGTSDCSCSKVSESLCRINACDLPGCCESFNELCFAFPSCGCLSSQCSDRALCCDNNIFRNCNSFCPLPTSSPTRFPTALPTPSPTRFPTALPTPPPTRFPTTLPTPPPTRFPTALPTPFPTTIFPSSVPIPSSTPTGSSAPTERNITAIWLQQGNTINDASSCDISFYGDYVVVGNNTGKTATVYMMNFATDNWDRRGTPIQSSTLPSGSAYDMKVSISDDGQIVALSDSGYSSEKGLVKVVQWNSTSEDWCTIGNIFIGSYGAKAGASIQLSSAGTITIAYTEMLYNGFGAVKVYTYDGSSWGQKGDVITTSLPSRSLSSRVLQDPSTSVTAFDMTPDGNLIVIVFSNGDVQLFRYSTIGATWELSYSFENFLGGRDISISRNGSIVAVCGGVEDGATRIFRSDRNGGYEYEHTISSDCDAVSLSNDGKTVAVGSSDTTLVRMYNNETWVSKGDSLSGGREVELVASGEVMIKLVSDLAQVFSYGVPLRYIGDCYPGQCGICMGDCDYDSDCPDGLKCFKRDDYQFVPGCTRGGIHDDEGADYCFEPSNSSMPDEVNYIGECRQGLTGRCGECEGDCDYDADCSEGLVCFQREDGETIPGCTGGSKYDIEAKDYCFAPKLPTEAGVLNYVGECDDTSGPCGECEGDCDSDDDCGAGLSCYERDALEAVPGCSGGSEFDIPGKDYCYLSQWISHGSIYSFFGNGRMGASVSLSSNGRRVAVSDSSVDFVYVYSLEYTRGFKVSSTQIGSRLNGTDVALSNSGNVVAIIGAGAISVYDLVYNDWVRRGGDISVSDANQIDISGSGDKICVVTFQLVSVYEYVSDNWSGYNITTSGASSVSISDDGLFVAIGDLEYSSVYVYNRTYDGVDEWSIIVTLNEGGSFESTDFGSSVALSSDGGILAVGAPATDGDVGAVYMYSYDGSTYVPKGRRIDPIGDYSFSYHGKDVDLSEDGNTVVIAGDYCCEYSSVFAARWNGTDWSMYGQHLQGDEPSFVSLSADGNTMSVGQPRLGDNGTVTIYKYV